MSKGSKAARVMGGEKKKSAGKSGKKSVHKMEIRRASSGGYVVTHHSKPDPNDPMGGQDPEEHVVGDVDQLQQHVADNIGDQPDAQQQEPAAEPAAAPAAAPVQGQ